MDIHYVNSELREIKKEIGQFKRRNWFRLPCLFHGNKVASNNPESMIGNFSTITETFQTSEGRWVYIIYAYPLSVIHRVLDTLMKYLTQKYCTKTISPSKWKKAFTERSLIPVMQQDDPSVVVLPYIDGENFRDILAGFAGRYTLAKKEDLIRASVAFINNLHATNIVWGELIVANMMRSKKGEIILCDTETTYYRGTIVEQKASDWLDFICSCCGDLRRAHPGTESRVVNIVMDGIANEAVKSCLKNMCHKKRSFSHVLFSPYTTARLSTPPWLYKKIKALIAHRPFS